MKCKSARTQIALSVGNDLDAGELRELKGHVLDCPPCRDYARELRSSLKVLHEPAIVPIEPAHASLWPRISKRLPKRAMQTRQSRFNGWAAAASVAAAACVLVAYGVTYQAPHGNQFEHPGMSRVVPGTVIDFDRRPTFDTRTNLLQDERDNGDPEVKRARDIERSLREIQWYRK